MAPDSYKPSLILILVLMILVLMIPDDTFVKTYLTQIDNFDMFFH